MNVGAFTFTCPSSAELAYARIDAQPEAVIPFRNANKASGLSDEAADLIRQKILGVV
jgi:hypothetical protein